MFTIVPVILAGGEGKRLYPVSSEKKPKQFLTISAKSSDTLFQSTLKRALQIAKAENVIIVSNINHKNILLKQASKINKSLLNNIIFEPERKNTAAAIATAAIYAKNKFDNAVLLVMPSDHIFTDEKSFIETIKSSIKYTRYEKIITFGISPTNFDSNYGYIMTKNDEYYGENVLEVTKFIEKPSSFSVLKNHIKGEYFWNSGIFMFSVDTILMELLKKFPPILRVAATAYKNGKNIKYGFIPESKSYRFIPALPIDKAVMEKSDKIIVVNSNSGWHDVGSFESLAKLGLTHRLESQIQNFITHHIAKTA